MWIRILFSIIISGVPTGILLAQDTTQHTSLQWDLETCLEYARRNNIQLNTLRLDRCLPVVNCAWEVVTRSSR